MNHVVPGGVFALALALIGACSFQEVNEGTADGAGAGTSGASTSSGAGGDKTNGGALPSIACGAATCTSPEKCCLGSSSCVAADAACSDIMGPAASPAPELYCDDESDCPSGHRCCGSVQGGSLVYECSADACTVVESCVGGIGCAPGSVCVADAAAPSGWQCAPTGGTPECGGAGPCGGDTPVCCWDAVSQQGTCVATSASCPSGASPMVCTSPTDCSAEYPVCCSGTGGVAMCQGSCASGVALCDTVADCPNEPSPATGCNQLSGAPAGANACVYP